MQCNASRLLVDYYYCHVQIVQYIKYIFTGWMFPSFVPWGICLCASLLPYIYSCLMHIAHGRMVEMWFWASYACISRTIYSGTLVFGSEASCVLVHMGGCSTCGWLPDVAEGEWGAAVWKLSHLCGQPTICSILSKLSPAVQCRYMWSSNNLFLCNVFQCNSLFVAVVAVMKLALSYVMWSLICCIHQNLYKFPKKQANTLTQALKCTDGHI